MNEPKPASLAQRMQIRPMSTIMILHAPEGYALGEMPKGCVVVRAGPADVVQVFFGGVADVTERVPEALAALKPGGILWCCYPKKTGAIRTDITRDYGWETLTAAGFEGVRQISIDESWSAVRFRPVGEIKRRGGAQRV